ncbi:hypothetical protein SAMN04489832_2709 [Micromonospora cremea]|uniref:Uncharacterized protein n=1 Tax=Micromonospora cremea TaxID=709881 RepID=A0A1N5WRW0_9ACTN|nr:hypothetical protein SAMN04489832_2709 [Micromonospora cremea]
MPPMSRVARLSIGPMLAVGGSALLAVGQPWLGSRTRVLDWHACFCDPGGDQSSWFITTFITWFQTMAVLVGAMVGRLAVPRLTGPGRAVTTVALTLAAAVGALVGIPVAVREVAIGRPPPYTSLTVASVREAAIVGLALGTVAAFGALWSARAAVGATLSWAWLWLVGLASTSHSGGYTAALGMLYGYSGRSAVARLADIIPLAIMAAITAGTAWWGTRRGGPRFAGMYAAILGPSLVLAAYLRSGFPNDNAGGIENAFALMLITMMAAAGGAAAGAWRGPCRHQLLDPLIIILAIAGILSAAGVGVAPVDHGPAPFSNPVTGTLVVAALLTLPFLPGVADSATASRREQVTYSPRP